MLIIDSDDYADSGIEVLTFPGGEPHAKVPLFKEKVLLHLKLRTWLDTGYAACVQDALYRQKCNFSSFIPYFPAARQDKTDGTAPLTCQMMSNFLAYTQTSVFDIHSSVCRRYIDFISYMPSDLKIPIKDDVAGIIAPDRGAAERAEDFRDTFYPKAILYYGMKERDSRTGRLSNYSFSPLKGAGRYIIVDDICDGGGTFNLLVEAFEKDPIAKNCKLEMFVSHGIFSKGLGAINSRIEHITTTDSWCRGPSLDVKLPERLTVISLLPQLQEKLV